MSVAVEGESDTRNRPRAGLAYEGRGHGVFAQGL